MLHVRSGTMFAGKTSYILHQIGKCRYAGDCLYINSIKDTRSDCDISTHNEFIDTKLGIFTTKKVDMLSEISDEEINKYSFIFIDEGQFIDDIFSRTQYIVEVLQKEVFAFGLITNAKREFFGNFYKLITIADDFKFIRGTYCKFCRELSKKNDAIFTYKLFDSNQNIDIGGSDKYAPLCRKCYIENI